MGFQDTTNEIFKGLMGDNKGILKNRWNSTKTMRTQPRS